MCSNQTLVSGSKNSLKLQETRNHVPDDLVNEIFKHLPAKSNYRFKCVSKQWFTLNSEALKLKTPLTMSGMFYVANEVKRNGLMSSIKYARMEEVGNEDSHIDKTLSFLPGCNHIKIHYSCNGLLLCESRDKFILRDGPSCLYVCNPATRKWVEIPFHYKDSYFVTFLDFNPLFSVDFNVVTIRLLRNSGHSFEVFSSKTREWKVTQVSNQMLHEYMFHRSSTSIFKGLIFCTNFEKTNVAGFDMEGNCCRRIALPGTSHQKDGQFPALAGGSLFQRGGYLNYSYISRSELYVWKLVDYKSGSWLLKYSFPIIGPLTRMQDLKFHPDLEEVVFFRIGDKLHSYNMQKTAQMIEYSFFRFPFGYFPYSPCFSGGFGDEVESK